MSELLTLIRRNPDSWSHILKNDPYCLKINREGDLACFTYSARSELDNSINKTARGIIIDVVKMQIVCYPLDRFFNDGERYASVLDWEHPVIALEKIDGSIIKLYYYNGNWCIATRGYCKADKQFQTQWNSIQGLDYSKLNKRYTYVFEIVGPSNKVVVEYGKNDLFHITTRDLDTLLEVEVDIGIKKPLRYDIPTDSPSVRDSDSDSSYSSISKGRVSDSVSNNSSISKGRVSDSVSNNSSISKGRVSSCKKLVSTFDPRKTEGVVLVDKWYNRVKVKSDQYILLHNQLEINNKGHSDQTYIQLILTGEANEYLIARPDMVSVVNGVLNRLNTLITRLEAAHADIVSNSGPNPSRKTFSDAVYNAKPIIPSLHFSLYEGRHSSVKEYIYAYNELNHYKLIAGHLEIDESKKSMEYLSWVRFGSPDSTDDDIAVVISNRNVQFDDSKLREELSDDKDLVRPLDINLITIGNDGHINWCHKGDLHETQNIIFHTYKYHQQKYSCPVSISIPVNAIDPEKKIRAVSKYFLDNCKELCGPEFYLKYKKQKDLSYSGTLEQRIAFVTLMAKSLINPYETSDLKPETPDPKSDLKSHLKSIVLKICQVILFEYEILEFNKLLIPEKIKTYWHCEKQSIEVVCENIAYFLSRGKNGNSNSNGNGNGNDRFETLQFLIEEYCQIARNYVENLTWHNIPVIMNTNTNTMNLENDDILARSKFYELFITSPAEPTDEMLDLFIKCVGEERSINKIFESESKNVHLLPPKFIESHVHLEAQRSNEWKKLLSFYRCGKNSGIRTCELTHIREYYRFHWNLIRGNVAENIVLNSLKELNDNTLLSGQLIQVGLLVEEKKLGSMGIAPDQLIKQNTGSIIPIEIKTVIGKINKNNTSFRREISLAKRQLNSSKQILKDLNPLNEAWIIVMFLENDQCSIEAAKV
jgi:hypothetical protein